MATAAAPRGSLVEYAFMDETTFGALPTGNWKKTLAYSDTLEEKKPFEDDPMLGLARHNNRDQTDPAPGLPDVGGTIIVPVDFNHIGYWLKGALGAPTSTGTTDYTHTFASGNEVLPHRSLERKLKSDVFVQHSGLLVDKLDFDVGRKAGYERCTVTFSKAFKEWKSAASVAGTPIAILPRAAVPAALPVFKVNGTTVADVLSLKLSYDNKAVPNESLGDAEGRIQGHDLDNQASYSGTLEMRFRNAVLYDLAKAGTAFAGELLWQVSATRSLSFQTATTLLAPSGLPIGGAGRIQQSFEMRAQQSAAAPMLTVVLKNGQAGTVYA